MNIIIGFMNISKSIEYEYTYWMWVLLLLSAMIVLPFWEVF